LITVKTKFCTLRIDEGFSKELFMDRYDFKFIATKILVSKNITL